MQKSNRDESKQKYGSFLDKLLHKPISILTDHLISPKNIILPSNSIELGESQNAYNKNKIEPVYLTQQQLSRHSYILGQSGSGKTYLILLMLMSLVQKNSGFAVLDIHGDLSRMIFNYISSQANSRDVEAIISKKLVLIQPFNEQYAPSFNPLSCVNRKNLYSEAFDMLGIFKRIWKDVAWGARMEELLRNLLITLSLTRCSLLEATSFLTDDLYRERIIDKLNDREVKSYWQDRFGALSSRMKPVYIEPVLNKLTVFTSDPFIRHILAQRETKLDFRKLMDEKKWIIINISKGTLSQNSHLLGSLFISKIKSSALSRTDINESRRIEFHLFVDEFQNFMEYNFEEILSEARKYKLSLTLAHQNLAQIDKSMRESIFGNVANTIFFRLGYNDIREVSNVFRESDKSLLRQCISTLAVGQAIHRKPDGSFQKIKIKRINPSRDIPNISKRLREYCYSRYYKSRSSIEADSRIAKTKTNSTISIISQAKSSQIKAKSNISKINEGIL